MPTPTVVREVMTAGLPTLTPDSTVLEAALLMRTSGLLHVPVVEGGRLVGLLSDRAV